MGNRCCKYDMRETTALSETPTPLVRKISNASRKPSVDKYTNNGVSVPNVQINGPQGVNSWMKVMWNTTICIHGGPQINPKKYMGAKSQTEAKNK